MKTKEDFSFLNKVGRILEKTEAREEVFMGKIFYVFPVSMIVAGVYNPGGGGKGEALFFSSEELRKSLGTWDGRPVSMDHPFSGSTMNTPSSFKDQWMGYVFNSRFEEEKSRIAAELWVDGEKSKWVRDRVSSGKNVEVSIGAFGKINNVRGVFLDKEYEFEYKDIRGDHLAVLTNMPAACSWEDGCGIRAQKEVALIRNKARRPSFSGLEAKPWSEVSKELSDFMKGFEDASKRKISSEVNSVSGLDSEIKRWIASKSLLGDPKATTFRELVFFPVVNPRTNKLNSGALRAVLGGRGASADIPKESKDSAQAMAEKLYNEHFKKVKNLSGEKQCEKEGREKDIISTKAIEACNRDYKGMDVEKKADKKQEIEVTEVPETPKSVVMSAKDILGDEESYSKEVIEALIKAEEHKKAKIKELSSIEFEGRTLCKNFLENLELRHLDDMSALVASLGSNKMIAAAETKPEADFSMKACSAVNETTEIMPRKIKW